MKQNFSQKDIIEVVDKLEKLEEEKNTITQNIMEVLSDAKIKGYSTKILRQLIKLRKMDHNERIRQEEELESYKAAIGML